MGDVSLTEIASRHGLYKQELAAFNRCRCYGNLLLLSNITSSDGSSIEAHFLHPCFLPRISTLSFPPECPTSSDWKVWTSFWTTQSGRIFNTRPALGSWLTAPHFQWNWFYDRSSDAIFSTSNLGFALWRCKEGRTRTATNYGDTGRIVPHHSGVPASFSSWLIDGAPRLSVLCTGPSFPPSHQDSARSLWDTLYSWGVFGCGPLYSSTNMDQTLHGSINLC